MCYSVVSADLCQQSVLVATAGRQCVNDLVNTKFSDGRRWYAAQFLDAFAK